MAQGTGHICHDIKLLFYGVNGGGRWVVGTNLEKSGRGWGGKVQELGEKGKGTERKWYFL